MEIPAINQFRLKTFHVVIKAIYGMLMIAVFVFVAVKLPYDNLWFPVFFLVPMLLMFGAFLFVGLGEITFTLTITQTHFIYKNLYGLKQIPFEEMKGFQLTDPGFRAAGFDPWYDVEIKSITGVTITTPRTTKDQDFLIEWLRANFTNLDSK